MKTLFEKIKNTLVTPTIFSLGYVICSGMDSLYYKENFIKSLENPSTITKYIWYTMFTLSLIEIYTSKEN